MTGVVFAAARIVDTVDLPAGRLAPTNPFFTAAYAAAMRAVGHEAWSFVGTDADGGERGAVGFVNRGRLNSTLILPSMPRLSADAPFWADLWSFCGKNRITRVSISTAASEGVDVPTVRGETIRIPRIEFVIDLEATDVWAGVGRSHRDRIKKARKNSLAVVRSRDEPALAAHVALHGHSMRRRASRGESVPLDDNDSFMRALLQCGAGELYQAVAGGSVCSSLLMVRSAAGAYSQSSGNSPEGMSIGASHFLRYETAILMGADGVREFFLGGCREHETGLRSFKQGFGAREIPMASVEAYVGGTPRRLFSEALNRIREMRHRRAAGPAEASEVPEAPEPTPSR